MIKTTEHEADLQGVSEAVSPVANGHAPALAPPKTEKRTTLGLTLGPNRMSIEESMASLFKKYDLTLRVLAGIEEKPEL